MRRSQCLTALRGFRVSVANPGHPALRSTTNPFHGPSVNAAIALYTDR